VGKGTVRTILMLRCASTKMPVPRAVKECLEQVPLLRKLQNFGFFVFRKFSLNACKKIGVGIIEVNQCPSG
jgi:hypothetical protein